MDLLAYIEKYWTLGLVACWIGYRWWGSYRVTKMLPQLKEKDAVFIDVRTVSEFNSAHADCCINIPMDEINDHLNRIPKNVPVVLCCASGTRSGVVKMKLKSKGYDNTYNVGKWTLLRSL